MIKIKQVEIKSLSEYDSIEFSYTSNKKYEIKKINNGLGGFIFNIVDIKPFYKKFKENTSMWKAIFDLSEWKFFIAYDNDVPVAGATLAVITNKEFNKKSAVLWDLRVIEKYKHQGIGQMLFDTVKESAKELNFKEFKIECQNTNYPAVNFYHKQGAILRCINDHAYIEYPEEVQMCWYLNL